MCQSCILPWRSSVRVCVRELGWCHGDDSSFSDLEKRSKCPLPAFFSVCPLLFPHFSSCQSLALQPDCNLACGCFFCFFLFCYSFNWFPMITHACPKARPSAFCQESTCLWSLCPCWASVHHWIDSMCRCSAMLPSMVLTFDLPCAVAHGMTPPWFDCHLRANSWSEYCHCMKCEMSESPLDSELDVSDTFSLLENEMPLMLDLQLCFH